MSVYFIYGSRVIVIFSYVLFTICIFYNTYHGENLKILIQNYLFYPVVSEKFSLLKFKKSFHTKDLQLTPFKKYNSRNLEILSSVV